VAEPPGEFGGAELPLETFELPLETFELPLETLELPRNFRAPLQDRGRYFITILLVFSDRRIKTP